METISIANKVAFSVEEGEDSIFIIYEVSQTFPELGDTELIRQSIMGFLAARHSANESPVLTGYATSPEELLLFKESGGIKFENLDYNLAERILNVFAKRQERIEPEDYFWTLQ